MYVYVYVYYLCICIICTYEFNEDEILPGTGHPQPHLQTSNGNFDNIINPGTFDNGNLIMGIQIDNGYSNNGN